MNQPEYLTRTSAPPEYDSPRLSRPLGTGFRQGGLMGLLTLVFLGTVPDTNGRSISKWDVFEQRFYSTRSYANPVQEARLTVHFVSPRGETNRIHGFWDGGTRWAVRFSPDELGHWTYTTECSDSRNSGLDGRSGKFLCTVQSLRNELKQHGSIRVAKGASTFQHSDGTPFFWTADNVWDGALKSTRKEWARYLEVRANQGFNVALWRAAPGTDDRGKTCFKGGEQIQIDPGVVRRLDEKITWLSESDMVSAIVPFWEIGLDDEELLPEDQVIVLLRQLVARWDAYHVAWVIAFEADTDGRRAARWRRIGRSVFDRVEHSPVILFCGSTHWGLKGFASEKWVNAVAFQSSNDISEEANLWVALGPVTTLWTQPPHRPILNLLPAPEAGLGADDSRIGTAQTLEAICRSLFVAPPAGVCYQSRATADWDSVADTNTVAITGGAMAEWEKSLYLPGATRIGQIRRLMEQNEFDRLLPASASLLLPVQSSQASIRPVSALATPRRDHVVLFLPQGGSAALPSQALRTELEGSFFSLLNGQRLPATPQQDELTLRFEAPGPGDWLLFLAPPSE